MTNKEIMNIALRQSAYDCNCNPEDFLSDKNLITVSRKHKCARKYLQLPLECNMVSYGNNIVAQTSERLTHIVENYINNYPTEHCFETPNIYVLNKMLKDYNIKVCFMAEYFLPDMNFLKPLPCDYELRVLYQPDFATLYTNEWKNALCEQRKELDVLAVGAYDHNKLIGLAGCSADCDTMYQIGVDVKPEYRRKGIASAITSKLALEIIRLGKVPFYSAAWCNVKSVRNAVKCGFRPAWVEITAKQCKINN